jgi:hypothetical protein
LKKNLFIILSLTVLSVTMPDLSAAETWDFLPAEPLFNPLIGDLREPHDNLSAQTNQSRFEGAVGQGIELLQWSPDEAARWGWGLEGASYIELDSIGNSMFPERVSDWQFGTYFSMKSDDLSFRLQYLHVSSHLGDELFYTIPRIIYSRESLRLTCSYDFSGSFRLYGGLGYWTHLSLNPDDPRIFGHAGLELYTSFFPFIVGTSGRGYFSYDLQVLGEAGGVIDQTFQVGLQWKWKKDSHQSIRMALLYYSGNSQYGQFYEMNDSHWGLGIFFDP